MRPQPKGVVGAIVPWNFPFDLSLGPLVEMLAAGNRVIIKPSEYTPACSEVLEDLVAATFDRDRVAVAVGGLDLAREFPTLRWDHLLYTGNPVVGREVAKAAAENLVPVTLELGGKNPAILMPGSVDAASVANIVGVKLVKSGQMCISVDYVLVPRDEEAGFVALAREHLRSALPGFSGSNDATGIITQRHLDRLHRLLGEARDRGAAHGTLPSLGFGGVGQSGYGRHHGLEGFREFSNPRAVFVRGEGDMVDAFLPPYGPAAAALVDAALGPV